MMNDNELNEAEMMAEHLAEKEKKEKLEAEARDARWKKQQEEQHKVRMDRELPILSKIAAAVGGFKSSVNGGQLWIDGRSMNYHIHIEEEHARISSWRSKPTGRYRIVVGDYGDRVSYPQRKDGSHNYRAIADKLCGIVRKQIAKEQIAAAELSNTPEVEALRDQLGLDEYGGRMRLSPSTDPIKSVLVKVEFSMTMLPTEVKKLHSVLVEFGVMKPSR